MLSEAILSAIVQSGITGAGLVLAIYALIIPISRRMFIYRAELLRDQIKLFEQQRKNLTPEATNKEFKRLRQMAGSIKETKSFPKYLSYGVSFTFTFYMLSAFIAFLALTSSTQLTAESELVIVSIFIIANSLFIFIGGSTIIDITLTMKREYDGIKQKLEQDQDFQGLFVK